MNFANSLPGALSVQFDALAKAGPAASISVHGTYPSSGTVGLPLSGPLVAKVSDQYGNAVEGATVDFAAGANSGTFSASVVTASNGLAAATPNLGIVAGTQTFDATTPNLAGAAQFTVTALPGPPTLLVFVSAPSTGQVGQAMAAPFGTMNLADMGADVIKLEPPGTGEPTRELSSVRVNGHSATFMTMNRDKRGLTVDLKRPEGVEIVRRLARTADVFVQNYRPGVAERLGLG